MSFARKARRAALPLFVFCDETDRPQTVAIRAGRRVGRSLRPAQLRALLAGLNAKPYRGAV